MQDTHTALERHIEQDDARFDRMEEMHKRTNHILEHIQNNHLAHVQSSMGTLEELYTELKKDVTLIQTKALVFQDVTKNNFKWQNWILAFIMGGLVAIFLKSK